MIITPDESISSHISPSISRRGSDMVRRRLNIPRSSICISKVHGLNSHSVLPLRIITLSLSVWLMTSK